MDAAARLEAVETENELLRERIAQLEALLRGTLLAPVRFRLTPQEERVLGVLMTREVATKETIHHALYGASGKDGAEIKIIDVFICKMRKKLKPFDIEVTTLRGRGYSLSPSTKARVQALAAEERAAA